MNLVLSLCEYNINDIYYGEKIKNTIIWNSSFIKIFYSTSDIILNGLFLHINLKNSYINNDNGKNKILFNTKENTEIINKIEQLEKTILHKINITNKTPRQSIYEQFKNGYLKLNSNNNSKNKEYILKISGIWVNDVEYGITFKILTTSRLSNNN